MVLHWFCYVFVMSRLILIVGPRPIFGYLMFSYCFRMVFLRFCYVSGWFWSSALARSTDILWFPMVLYWFSESFVIFQFDFDRRPSPYPRLSYVFLWFFHWFWYVFDMFPIDFNHRPSPDLRLSYDFLSFSYGFPTALLCFRLILIVGPRPIFGYLMISYGFPLVFLWFCYVSGWF